MAQAFRWMEWPKRWAAAAVEFGTAGYPPKTRRRLRSVNLGCYAVAVVGALFALTYALEDATLYRGAVIINLVMMAAALTVPPLHRFNEVVGALSLSFVLLTGLFLMVALVGREAGIQINFVAASALAFLVFELRRLHLIMLIIVAAIALHIASWLLFPHGMLPDVTDDAFLVRQYAIRVVTISVIIAVVVYYAFWTAEEAEARTERLLYRILPVPVAERLRASPDAPISDSFAEAAVLFSDLAGFVPISRALGARRTVEMLNQLVRRFDRLAAEHGVEKIKTIGDAYMAAAIGPHPAADNAARLARMALNMQAAADATGAEFGVPLSLRIGMALGPVMAGVIGERRFGYDVWGDPVNLAARLENSGEPGRIQVSTGFREALGETFAFEPRGPIEVKGVGREETWFLTGEAG